MASKQPSTTTQIQKIELPKWVDEASEDNYKLAKDLSTQPFQQYQGERVAPISKGMQDAFAMINANAGKTGAGYDDAMGMFEKLFGQSQALDPTKLTADRVKAGTVTAGQTDAGNTTAGSVKAGTTNSQNAVSQDVTAKMLADMDLSKYMNPYTDEVETKSLDALDRSRQQSILGNQSAAQAAGAFGSSRHGITDAVTNSESAREAGLLSANLRQSNYNNATNLATGDITRQLATDTGNADRSTGVSVGNANRQLQSDTGNMDRILQALTSNRDATLASDTNNVNRQLSNSMANRDAIMAAATGNRDAALAADTGNAARNLQAGGMNAQNILDTFAARSGAGNAAAGGLMEALGGKQTADNKDIAALLQMGGIQQGQNQAQIDAAREKFGESRANDIDNLNMRLAALGMSPYGKTETTNKTTTGGQSGTDWGQMGMGIFSALLGLSEDDTKTDKEKVGKLPGTDLEMWAFRYKKDPKHYPKVVGVMASDVQKKMPEAVHMVDGKRVINYGMIGEAMAANG
jgi:hypothetical protein